APEPDRPPLLQIADHDPVRVPLADRYLVDPDNLRLWLARSTQLLAHILHVQIPDGPPIQARLLGYVLDRHGPAASSHEEGEALGVEWVARCQPVQLLLLHLIATSAVDSPDLQ